MSLEPILLGAVAYDPKDIPGTLKVEATFNTKSIDTHNAERDADLRSEQFLNVAKFPTMKFVSTSRFFA